MKIKTKKIAQANAVLGSAKLGKLESADQLKVFKAIRAIKPVADAYIEAEKLAVEKLKPEDYDEVEKLSQRLQADMRSKVTEGKTSLTPDEIQRITDTFTPYNKRVKDALEAEGEKEVEVSVEKVPVEVFLKLVTSNEWTMEQAMNVEAVLCE